MSRKEADSERFRRLSSMAKERRITDLNDILFVAKYVLNQPRSQETQKRYERYYFRHGQEMDAKATQAGLSMHSYIESLPKSKQMKNWLSAMFQVGAAQNATLWLHEVHKARRVEDKERGRNARKRAADLVHQIFSMEPDYDRKHWADRSHVGLGFSDTGMKSKKRQKRRELRLLPADWKEKVIREVNEEFQRYALVQAVSGCRTIELVKGVSVWAKDDKLFFRIQGAKTGQGHGQKWRQFSVAALPTTLAWELYEHVKSEPWGLDFSLSETRKGAYGKHISAAARGAKCHGASPISFRHQMASDLRFSKYSPEMTAQIMGHCSGLTAKKNYGLKHKGQNIKISDVQAAQPVRIHKSKSQKPSHRPQKPGPK